MTRLVCACGTIIPTDRAGGKHCSPGCDETAARREREETQQQLLDESAQQLSDWYRDQRTSTWQRA